RPRPCPSLVCATVTVCACRPAATGCCACNSRRWAAAVRAGGSSTASLWERVVPERASSRRSRRAGCISSVCWIRVGRRRGSSFSSATSLGSDLSQGQAVATLGLGTVQGIVDALEEGFGALVTGRLEAADPQAGGQLQGLARQLEAMGRQRRAKAFGEDSGFLNGRAWHQYAELLAAKAQQNIAVAAEHLTHAVG